VKTIFTAALVGLIISIAFNTLNTYLHQQNIGTLHVDKIIQHHIAVYGQKPLSPEQRVAVSKAFTRLLDKSIRIISEQNHVILMPHNAIISEVPDYTNMVTTYIDEHLNENENSHP